MTWHLKDRELEKNIIAIDPEFIDKLQIGVGRCRQGFYLELGGCVYCGDVGVPKIQVYFVQEDLEEVPEYNPNAWNEYPKVKPPYNMMMRIKMKNGYLRAGYLKKFPDGDSWVNPNGVLMCNAENAEIELFRPWSED